MNETDRNYTKPTAFRKPAGRRPPTSRPGLVEAKTHHFRPPRISSFHSQLVRQPHLPFPLRLNTVSAPPDLVRRWETTHTSMLLSSSFTKKLGRSNIIYLHLYLGIEQLIHRI